MKQLITILLNISCILFSLSASPQSATLKAIKLNRIEVTNGILNGSGAPSSNIINLLSLQKRCYKNYYEYWALPYSNISNVLNPSGSLTSVLKSTPIEISVTNNNQELILKFANKSNYWIGLDISSISYNISYFVNGNIVNYPAQDFSKTLGTLFNYERGEYDFVLLPPRAETIATLFRIDGFDKGYDIIHTCIKDGSKMNFEVPFMVYESDPFSSVKSSMTNRQAHQYAQHTPIQSWLNYKGGYYKEGEAIHIHNDYTDLVKPSYSYTVHSGTLKFVCDIDIQSKTLRLYKNKFGLYVFDE